jgi:nucleotide-binding universal stress UspA family protein
MEKIVVGIDGSQRSKDALRWAVDHARAGGAEVVALHAYELPAPVLDAAPAAPVDLPGLVTAAHEAALEFVTEVVGEDVGSPVTVNVVPIDVEDSPAKALLEASRDADLLVVGSHGLDVSDLLLGSVSFECAQHASCPVLIYRDSERPTETI